MLNAADFSARPRLERIWRISCISRTSPVLQCFQNGTLRVMIAVPDVLPEAEVYFTVLLTSNRS